MSESRKQRIRYLTNIKAYLSRLNDIMKCEVSPNELIPHELEQDISPVVVFELDYAELSETPFFTLLKKIDNLQKQYFLFTDGSKECGVLPIKELARLNYQIDTELNHNGIISIVDVNEENAITFDYEVLTSEETVVEVTIEGSNWIAVYLEQFPLTEKAV